MAKQSTLEGSFDIPSDQDLRNLIVDSIPETAGLVSLKGFKMDLSANREFRKFFFAARCECKTSALLSVEIAEDKKNDQEFLSLCRVFRLGGPDLSWRSFSFG